MTVCVGALQRWVRECDFALQQSPESLKDEVAEDTVNDRKNISLLLLDAVMRVALDKNVVRSATNKKHLPSTAVIHQYQMSEEPPVIQSACASSEGDLCRETYSSSSSAFKAERVRVVSHVPGASRRPPSSADLNIFTMAPRSISFVSMTTPALRVDVEKVNGTFLMQNVLSKEECSQLIAAAEAIGYSHDAVEGIDNIVLFADDSLINPIFERCRHLLPQRGLVGINSRFRFFRYAEGAVYRPHIGDSPHIIDCIELLISDTFL